MQSTNMKGASASSFSLALVVVFGCSSTEPPRAGTEAAPEAGPGGSGGSSASGGVSAASGGSAIGGAGGTGAGAGGASTGGSRSTGGNRSTGGAPDHVVADCQGLPGVDHPELVTPDGVDTEHGASSVVVDPIHAGTVYLGTDHRGLFKSTDCGAHWTKINTGTGGDILDSGTMWSLYIDPVNPERLYAGSLYGKDLSLLRSNDAGVSWASVFPKGSEVAGHVEYNFFQEAGLEIDDPRHLVVSFHANCSAPYASMCMAESKDGGDTWRIFDGPTGGWGENARPFVLGPTTFLFATWNDGVFYTGDAGKSWERISGMPGANHQMYRRADGTLFLGSHAGVFQSKNGREWTKIEGSPAADALAGDGQRLFTGHGGDQAPIFAAPEAAAAPWTGLTAPKLPRLVAFAMDPDHHLLFGAATDSGLYRMVTRP